MPSITKRKNWKKEAKRLRNLLNSIFSDVDRAKLSSAMNDVVPKVGLIRRGDVFRIVKRYNQLIKEELEV